VLNASNEVAVHAFLRGRLRFLDIPAVIETSLATCGHVPVRSFDDLYDADAEARSVAASLVERLAVRA